MGFTKFLTSTGIISALHDKPNIEDGLDSATLKGKFDQSATDIKNYINNTLIGELEGSGAAANIGITPITNFTLDEDTVQKALEKLVDTAISGLIPDGSVTTVKIDDGAVTATKIAYHGVKNGNLEDEAVNSRVLADGSVDSRHIRDNAITTNLIRSGAVTYSKTAGLQREMSKYNYTIPQTEWDATNKMAFITFSSSSGISQNDFVSVLIRHDGAYAGYPSVTQIGKWGISVSGVIDKISDTMVILSCNNVPTMDVPVEFVVLKPPAA